MQLVHEELTRTILAAFFDVINELGTGFLKSVYEKALLIDLQQKGLTAIAQVPLAVTFRGQNVGQFRQSQARIPQVA